MRFLVEAYVADSPAAYAEASERAERASAVGRGVRHVETTFLPSDEIALHIFEAPSLEELEEAGRLAALRYERIVEARHAG
jgi:hypothetical protein